MSLKNFLISTTKSIIILLVATLIFSSVTFDFPSMLKNVFGDVFGYASPEMQKKVINELSGTCSSLEDKNSVTLQQVCTNATLLESMYENCRDYKELKRINVKIENAEQIKETCLQLESEEIESKCNELKQNSLLPDFNKIGALCKDYKSGKISDKEFFYNVVGSSMPSQENMPQINIFDKYNKAINYLNNNKIVYLIILMILFLLLYLLVEEIQLFLTVLGQISLSIGTLILLPYLGIVLYDKFVGFDTSSILGSMFGLGNLFDFKAIISVILLLFLRTYNVLIIILGIIFLGIGIAGKIYAFKIKRKLASEEISKKEPIDRNTIKTKKSKK